MPGIKLNLSLFIAVVIACRKNALRVVLSKICHFDGISTVEIYPVVCYAV